MKQIFISLILLAGFSTSQAQNDTTVSSIDPISAQSDTAIVTLRPAHAPVQDGPVYKIKNIIDLPVTAATTAYTLWGFSQIYGRDDTPESVILALDKEDIPSIDRSTWDNHSQSAKNASDKLFYGSMPLPLVFLLDKEMRRDGLKLGLLYLQAMSTFGVFYTSSAMIADRFRPYTYNPAVPLDRRTGGGGKNSFMSGHPGLVATSTFFVAKVFSDYHPEWRNKWILYTLAGGASVATGILRVKAGEHFPTDVMVGIPVGVLTGILIPHIHKNKDLSKSRLTLTPLYGNGGAGFHATYKLTKPRK